MKTQKAGDFTAVTLGPEARLFSRKLGKFKTDVFKVFLETPLSDSRRATAVALLPSILKRGCRRFPDQRQLSRYLEKLYGASLGAGVSKIGERQVVSFRLEVLSDRYARRSEKVREKALHLLRDVILDPVVEGDAFPESVFRQEVANQERQLRSRINEKAQYAAERHIEEMCQGEPYAIYEYGRLEDLASITSGEVFSVYRSLIEKAPLKVFAVGDFEIGSVAPVVKRVFEGMLGFERRKESGFPPVLRKPAGRPRTVVESTDVTQGKLVLGFRTGITVGDRRYFGLLFANAILGSGPFSKLFRNVREKAQLAYYAQSGLDRVKGILTVHCGIAFHNFEKAVRIVKRQVDDIKAGRVTDDELAHTRLSLTRSVRAGEDSAGQKIDGFETSLVAGRIFSMNQLLKHLKSVRRADVAAAARTLRLDTVYFLRGPAAGIMASPPISPSAVRARRNPDGRRGDST